MTVPGRGCGDRNVAADETVPKPLVPSHLLRQLTEQPRRLPPASDDVGDGTTVKAGVQSNSRRTLTSKGRQMNTRTMRDVLALEDLRSGATGWADLPLRAKIAMLEALPPRILDVAPRMAAAAIEAKGIP